MSYLKVVKVLGRRLLSRRELRFAFTITLAIMAFAVIESCIHFYGSDINALPSAAYGWVWNMDPMQIQSMRVFVHFLIFIIASMVFADNFLDDTKNGAITCIVSRCSLAHYVKASATLVFFGGFFITLIPLAISQLLALLIFPVEGSFAGYFNTPVYVFTDSSTYLFPYLAYNHPYLHNLIFACYASFWAGSMALLSFSVSLIYKKNKLVVIGIPSLISLISWYVIPLFINSSTILTHFNYLYPSPQTAGFNLLYFVAAPLAVLVLSAAIVSLSLRTKREMLL